MGHSTDRMPGHWSRPQTHSCPAALFIGLLILTSCLVGSPGWCVSDVEIFELLSGKSKEVTGFPFHVFVAPDHAGFEGTALPVSSYGFFQPFYGELEYAQPDEIFATYQFPQGRRWKCFLLRVPSKYESDAIDLWIFDRKRGTWQKPIRMAERWGDAGYSKDTQAWIEDLSRDGRPDIIVRTVEKDVDLENPKASAVIKTKNTVFIWEKGRFIEKTRKYWPRIDLSKYTLNEKARSSLD